MSPRPPRRRLGWKLFPFWLEANAAAFGVPFGALAVAALIALIWVVLDPHYPARDVTGRITGLGFKEVEGRGSVSMASVDVEGDLARVELPSRHGCHVGDQVQLRQLGLRWGYAYHVPMRRWPCQRQPPPYSN